MAFILKPKLTLPTPYGIELANPYLIVDQISVDKLNRKVSIMVSLYASKDARNSGANFIEQKGFTAKGAEFTSFYNPALNIFKCAYLYLSTITEPVETEEGVIQRYIFENWQSDEV